MFHKRGALQFSLALDNNGALYIPYFDPGTQTYRYDEIPVGASSPSRTIVDTLLTGSTAGTFSPFAMTALTDGTLYVGEWSLLEGDPLAGLYIYPGRGKERFVSNGAAAPTGTAVDSSGNLYVLNNNTGFQSPSFIRVCDTLHTLSTYTAGAKTLLSQATTGFVDGDSLTVGKSGLSFISEFPYGSSLTCQDNPGTGAIATVAPGGTVGNTLVSNLGNQDVVIYDGIHATGPYSQALP